MTIFSGRLLGLKGLIYLRFIRIRFSFLYLTAREIRKNFQNTHELRNIGNRSKKTGWGEKDIGRRNRRKCVLSVTGG